MRVGFPIRKSADQRSLASPRGLSQRATSFIASWRQGIHRTPLIRSRSTPSPAHSTKPRQRRRPGPCQACSQLQTQTHNSTLRYFNQIPDLPVNEQTNPHSFAASGSAVSIKHRNQHTRRPKAARCRGISAAKPRKWRRSGSNRRPPACKAGALPAELRPHTPRGPT